MATRRVPVGAGLAAVVDVVVVVDVLLTGALVVVVLVVVELLELQPDRTIATTNRILRHRKGMVNRCLFK
jgi:hypothetical protein